MRTKRGKVQRSIHSSPASHPLFFLSFLSFLISFLVLFSAGVYIKADARKRDATRMQRYVDTQCLLLAATARVVGLDPFSASLTLLCKAPCAFGRVYRSGWLLVPFRIQQTSILSIRLPIYLSINPGCIRRPSLSLSLSLMDIQIISFLIFEETTKTRKGFAIKFLLQTLSTAFLRL